MPVTQITRAALGAIAKDIEAALETVAKNHGINIRYKGGQYSNAATGEVKLAIEVQQTASGVSGAEATFREMAPLLGIDPDAFGQVVMVQGKPYRICGYYSAPKFNIEARRHDGKVFRLSGQDIARQFPLRKAA